MPFDDAAETLAHHEGDVEACTTIFGVLSDSAIDASPGGDDSGVHSPHSAPSIVSCGKRKTLPVNPRGFSENNPLVVDLIEDQGLHTFLALQLFFQA